MSYAFLAGTFDIGMRFAVYRYLTAGIWQSFGAVNNESWRRFAPTMAAAFATSWIMAPLEVARKAFHADRSFPVELQKGYTSIPQALCKLATTNPYALFKNSLPTVMASYIQTSFLFATFDYFYDLTSPLFRDGGVPKGAVKFALTN
jgi:solute carrier family 25 oxoglutarate transporter 11